MKKFFIFLVVLIFISCFQANADKNKVVIERYQTGHLDKSTNVRRSPMRIPIDVYYDDVSRQLEVSGDEGLDGQVFLCDENENTLAYSPCLNTVLDVPYNYNGQVYIRIEGVDWIATGEIAV